MTNRKELLREFLLMNLGTPAGVGGGLLFQISQPFFHGGVSGLAVLLGKLLPQLSPSTFNTIINVLFFGAGLCNAQQGLRRPDGLLFHSLRRAHSAL